MQSGNKFSIHRIRLKSSTHRFIIAQVIFLQIYHYKYIKSPKSERKTKYKAKYISFN